MSELRIVYSTFPNRASAERVADHVVAKNLAACVNLFPMLSSTYKWKGKTEKTKEVVFLAKTHKKNLKKLLKTVEALHPYEVPCLLSCKPNTVNKAYAAWAKGA